ncbi:MAG: AbrB/MazE/SpoVT family DNA-binding domain-containing protein [Chloroflexi bacterium]|nr:AbrB/MazE/SpoVT family DNA-binding domain-containing protein [Chloroflexota bacterium]
MRAEVKKWNESLAICIPKDLADEIELEVGSEVDMRFQDGEIRIRRARKPKRYDLDELLASVPDDFEPED